MPDVGYTIRPCCIADAATIAHHRVAMFIDMGEIPSDEVAQQLLTASIAALAAELERGSYFGWFAVSAAGEVIGGVGAHVKPQLPRLAQGAQKVADSPVPLVVNVFTDPAWRHRGVATSLMRCLMNWAIEQRFDRVVLHASAAGRALYTSLGFRPTNEMRWANPATTD
jgi:GNAT superfamily N-acetyltransferase